MEEKNSILKKSSKNIVLVMASNVFNIFSGIASAFLIPFIMGINDFGNYKVFTLYLTYIGLFSLGFCDGINLLYSGELYKDLNKSKFRSYTKLYLLSQSSFLLIFSILSLALNNSDYSFIVVSVGLCLFANNISGYFQHISQCTFRFKELSIRNIIRAGINLIVIVILTVLYLYTDITIDYKNYVIIFVVIQFILMVWYCYTYKDIIFGESEKIKDNKNDIIKLYKIGIPLLLSNLIVSFIINLDRQIVSIFYDKETYAVYAFAYNMLSIITTTLSAISLVIYPYLRKTDESELKKNYTFLLTVVAIFVSFCLIGYFPIVFIVVNFLPKYIYSLEIFKVILPGLIFSSCISIIIYNYYKILNIHFSYFKKSFIVLIVSAIVNFICLFVFNTPISISIGSIVVFVFWYIFVSEKIDKYTKIKSHKVFIYILSNMSFFYLITYFIDNIYLALLSYLLLFFVNTIIYYSKDMKNFIKKLHKNS